MRTHGVVRFWSEEHGWGVIDSEELPGGCWAHFSHVAMSDYRTLSAGDNVGLEWEAFEQDGYAYRAIEVQLEGEGE